MSRFHGRPHNGKYGRSRYSAVTTKNVRFCGAPSDDKALLSKNSGGHSGLKYENIFTKIDINHHGVILGRFDFYMFLIFSKL